MNHARLFSALAAGLCATLGLLTFGATEARAMNCDRYAANAVQHQRTNLARRCGFRGQRWHTNFGGHKTWCVFTNGRVRQREHRHRVSKLASCKLTVIPPKPQPVPAPKPQGAVGTLLPHAAFCQNYASRSTEIARRIRRVCKSGYYRVDFNGQLRKCLSWSDSRRRATADGGIAVLIRALEICPRR